MNHAQRQAAALGIMVVSSAGLYWARAEWLVWGLMGLIGIAMLSSIAGEGGR